jgi:hypothetical protein
MGLKDKVSVTITLPDQLYAEVKALCKLRKITVAEFVEQAIEHYITKLKQEPPKRKTPMDAKKPSQTYFHGRID